MAMIERISEQALISHEEHRTRWLLTTGGLAFVVTMLVLTGAF